MTTDLQFTSTGPASVGFQTSGNTLDAGASVSGKSNGGTFAATGTGPSIAAVSGASAYGSGFIAGNLNDDSTLSDIPLGIYGESLAAGGVGVRGLGAAYGVYAETSNVAGDTRGFIAGRDPVFNEYAGVYGASAQAGVFGNSDGAGGTGVHGRGGAAGGYGVRGESSNGTAVHGKDYGSGVAISGESSAGGLAARFVGDVRVEGVVRVSVDVQLDNGDVAERFPLDPVHEAAPGRVMVLTDQGSLHECGRAYDRRVVGVVSGAGALKPAIMLRAAAEVTSTVSISLTGTAYCWVDASHGLVEIGDLLTTSATPGHAMKVDDFQKGFGATIGKALQKVESGRKLIPILIAIQ